ncbi:hypothetical protein QFW77_09185 [Luteimonas sp. RD2P54]|uniref:Uncharacterized protein n=1 Tax=Luteimonas endophytica TaxID=3042023 RepID=A0ABT6J8L9_9GAMM|nr:hypothetical protein [Luteimonas endophytica]MDH5823158.1 hypothetical protein [Luteimonas endophytica]
MSRTEDWLDAPHDPRDPNPWLALYLDASGPLAHDVKCAWLADAASRSRQFVLPVVRPLARLSIVLIQLLKIVLPNGLTSSKWLHRTIVWGMKTFVRPEANWLILRHFHLGSQVLAFIGRNALPGRELPSHPLRPADIDALRDDVFLQHDLNLFNFVIELNRALGGRRIEPPASLDFSMIEPPPLRLEDMPRRWTNFIDLQTAIEIYTPVYQLFLTDNDFWRATNSLQLDETIGIYCATLLQRPDYLVFLNNKHPLVPLTTLRAGFRLVLHGLSTEMLHALLSRAKAEHPQPVAAG